MCASSHRLVRYHRPLRVNTGSEWVKSVVHLFDRKSLRWEKDKRSLSIQRFLLPSFSLPVCRTVSEIRPLTRPIYIELVCCPISELLLVFILFSKEQQDEKRFHIECLCVLHTSTSYWISLSIKPIPQQVSIVGQYCWRQQHWQQCNTKTIIIFSISIKEFIVTQHSREAVISESSTHAPGKDRE